MSKNIDTKKLAQMAKGGGSKHFVSAAKGMVIGYKRPRDKAPDIWPIKKGKFDVESKWKGTMPLLEARNKGT